MQGSQEETPQCNFLGRKLYVEECFAKSAKRIENFRSIGKPPEFALGQFSRRRPIQHLGGTKRPGISREGDVSSLEFYTGTGNVCIKL